ncbi:dihydroorotase [Halospeciosus flavus]|uniref:Dihydroorotase n=1 Tax=Halospeciosus flavus TaxID=3032283 RepID=A0ABD5Z6L9_9EURY|nr:dihydroorotase [Halospeciosus flavus]
MRVIRNAELADGRTRDVRIADDGRIDAVGEDLDGETLVDADGMLLLPGMVDVHVHFRQPGDAHKETWSSGSRSAAAGGVTTVVDQPNTDPPTTTGEAFDAKEDLARNALVDYGINGGVTEEWDPDSLFERPLFALGEVFLADSTGDMGIDTELFETALERAADADVPVTVHAEDADLFDEGARERDDADAWSAYRTAEAEQIAVEDAVAVADGTGAQVHVAHTSTPEGVDAAKDGGATCEVTPHHLFLSRDDLDALGTFGRMNPPLRSEERRAALVERLVDGTIDVVATDHAPHTREEKQASIWDAPSGVPGVETALPLLLAAARDDDTALTFERVRDVTAANPADIFGLPQKGRIEEGRDADLVLVDPDETEPIRGERLHSKCSWTPFEGFEGVFPKTTLVRGNRVYDRLGGAESFLPTAGQNVRR